MSKRKGSSSRAAARIVHTISKSYRPITDRSTRAAVPQPKACWDASPRQHRSPDSKRERTPVPNMQIGESCSGVSLGSANVATLQHTQDDDLSEFLIDAMEDAIRATASTPDRAARRPDDQLPSRASAMSLIFWTRRFGLSRRATHIPRRRDLSGNGGRGRGAESSRRPARHERPRRPGNCERHAGRVQPDGQSHVRR